VKRIILTGLVVLLTVGCTKKKEYSAPTLLQQLKDTDPKNRSYAARELGHFGNKAEEVVPALSEALRDEDKDVRMRAAYSLGEIGPPDAKPAIPALETALKDREPTVRRAADHALKQLRGQTTQVKDDGKSTQPRHKRHVTSPAGPKEKGGG
jgi:HEAT repeat protein